MAGTIRWSITAEGLGTPIADYGSETYTVGFYNEHTEATGTTDTAISIGDVTTGAMLWMKSDQTITLNINANTGTNITVTANKPMILVGSSITALYISNASGSTANVKYLLAGV